jgi:hypothetical protein
MSFLDWFKKPTRIPTEGFPRGKEHASENPVGWIRTKLETKELIRHLKLPRDVRVMISGAGAVIAMCKACSEHISPVEKDGLLWLVCPRCGGITFIVVANLPRDIHFAQEAGGLFVQEAAFQRNLPSEFTPPDTSQTSPGQSIFAFTVEHIFQSDPPEHLVALVGTIFVGAVCVGDSLTVGCQCGDVSVVVERILTLDRGEVKQAHTGHEVALAVRGIHKDQPAQGDVVRKGTPFATFTVRRG